MLKNQKGVTMTLLVITIIVLFILFAVTITTSTDLMKSSKIRNAITIMTLVKLETEKIYENYDFDKDTAHLQIIGAEKFTVSGTQPPLGSQMSSEELSKIDAESSAIRSQGVRVDDLWYKWTSTTLDELKIDYSNVMKSGEYFIVNYATGEIIFSAGVNSESGIKLYSLTGLKEIK